MKATIIGRKQTAINDNGNIKRYYKLFLTHKNPRDNEFSKFEGIGCSEVSVPYDIFAQAEVGRDCVLDYDCNKKLLDFEMV